MAQEGLARARQAVRAAPLPAKILLVIALLIVVVLAFSLGPRVLDLLILIAIGYGPVAVWRGSTSVLASVFVAAWGLIAVLAVAAVANRLGAGIVPLLLLPCAAVPAAHARALTRKYVPCRTVAWIMLWALPPALLAWWLAVSQPAISYGIAWVLGLAVAGWRLGKAQQEARALSRQQGRTSALAAPYRPGGGPAVAARPSRRPGPPGPARAGQPGEPPRVLQTAEGAMRSADAGAARDRGATDAQQPEITLAQAMAELENMIGLESVKEQIRQITASVEAARRRELAGYQAEKPMQHFVFLGPPGTGKTSVARVIAKIFYAFGLLDTPVVIEAQRADLVGEYLGATAIKTNELVDRAIGGVLFIDEAYSLINDSEGQGDRFGHEAVQALLKRAEDDRAELIIILAGYEKQMETFLASNPGLNSRFGLRVKFPTYTPAELMALAELDLERRREILDPDARPALWRMMEDIGRRRLADELGNGRFVRSLLEKAGRARDVRVMAGAGEPAPAELVTLEEADLIQAGAELTARFRGYTEAPTLENALAELDELVGLEPVKRQVHEIAAQLQVARLRERHRLSSRPPARHFVFTGPPGTGKTTVARILGRIFTALGLLVRPEVIEAHRADLVGEHLGSTAIKTAKLIDSALGGVLFIDEAYSLYNMGYSGGDAYGSEAVATLLKRAEDDRDRLVIVLAGYPADMDRFLHSNPGLASRFSTRIGFPSYSPDELCRIAGVIAEQHGDTFEPEAVPVLAEIFTEAAGRGQIDELGNGRFARSLFERACAARDLRVADLDDAATQADLTTVSAADLRGAFRELGGPAAG
ncbi:MAG TPA: AAA family ATPase [Streptosporangiaceae bacterium]|nr:AAA family ATPase [Streptosporangiaceae bacterium]